MMKVTKDTLIGDIVNADRSTAPFFFEMGMHCLGCPASASETLEEACMVHGASADDLVRDLNDYLGNNQ